MLFRSLSLAEIEVAVAYSVREDGVKLSVRSENPAIHAGNLLHTALKDIGNGGGHASMGGGFISINRLPEAGHLQTDYIRNLLLDTLSKESCPAIH